MTQEPQDLFEDKVFSLKPFKQLYSTILIIAILIVITAGVFYLFFPPISSIFGIQLSGGFNFSVIIVLLLIYSFIQQSMLRKIIGLQNFQDKVLAYYTFYKIRLFLVFTILCISCILLVLNGDGGDFFWIIINTGLLIFLKPSTKIIPQELKENDIQFV
ncbi:MAG: hypothetical protein ACOVMI_04230 [Chitinophagaceae bacterium]